MRSRYSQEVREFIVANVKGRTLDDLVELVNAKFELKVTAGAMKSYKKNHGLKSGTSKGRPKGMPSKRFPAHVAAYILANHKGVGLSEMAEKLNAEFKTDYTAKNIKGYYGNHRLCSGVSCRFMPGHVPTNKGKKGYCPPGSEKGWFKKGDMPHNHKPVGSERVNVDGYIEVKVSEPKKWVPKHKIVWEENNGRIPKGCVVTMLDGNRLNTAPGNLACISRAEHLVLNRSDLRSIDADYTQIGILVAKIKCKASKLSKK